jgi:hypothetical protein
MSEHDDLQSLKDYTAGDEFRYNHRHRAGFDTHWASDLDLVLIEREPNPHISAFLEFKNDGEPIRFTQAVMFETFQPTAPVFIVIAENDMLENDPDEQVFTVERFDEVEDLSPSPPDVATTTIKKDVPWGGLVDNNEFELDFRDNATVRGLIEWEDELRRQGRHFRGGGD